MKRLGITQRVEVIADRGERRDCLDQRWAGVADALGFVPVPLSNLPAAAVPALLDALQLEAIVLSGGNTLSVFDPSSPGAAPERDAFEAELLDHASRRDIPVVGVCRGMQMIYSHLGGKLVPITGHVATRHELDVASDYQSLIATAVNSFHDCAIPLDQLPAELLSIATADRCVEAFVHRRKRIAGIMWHPEREQPFRTEDLALLERFLR